jgi:hypothetical protein
MDHEQAMEKASPGTPSGDNCHVLHVVQQAEWELHELTKERAGIAKRILSVKQTIIGLADLFGDDILDTALLDLFDRKGTSRRPGITLACRRILMEAGQPMSARDVCDGIQRTSPELLAHHKYPMATIYTILGRLVYYGEVTGLHGDRGERSWQWAAAERKNELIAPDAGGNARLADFAVVPDVSPGTIR